MDILPRHKFHPGPLDALTFRMAQDWPRDCTDPKKILIVIYDNISPADALRVQG
jgi:hypothetical protein